MFGRNCTEIDACIHTEHFSGEHRRLNENDVSDHEKRRHAGQYFCTVSGLVLREFEQALDHRTNANTTGPVNNLRRETD